MVKISALDKPPPPAPPPSVEHILPGGIGTYSISHISCFNQTVPKPEGSIFTVARAGSSDMNDENSNCNTYTASGFTLWEESHAPLKKGKTRKENMGENPAVTRGMDYFHGFVFTLDIHACNSYKKTKSICYSHISLGTCLNFRSSFRPARGFE